MQIHQEVLKAEKRIRQFIRKTPLEFSPYLSKLCNCNVYLKLKSEQLTGSFKIRGAFNEIRCKQKNSYRSRTCSLPSLQNDGRMNIFMGYGDFRSPFFIVGNTMGNKWPNF